jgi:tRNA(Ile2) C34 agmatinyltransferase TiaS
VKFANSCPQCSGDGTPLGEQRFRCQRCGATFKTRTGKHVTPWLSGVLSESQAWTIAPYHRFVEPQRNA